MGKKKKSRGPDEILARARKMFQRGNYPLSKIEFEKVAGIAGYGEFAEEIGICEGKIREARAEELVKRARKHAGKGDFKAALRWFEEAYAITGQDSIREQVSRFQKISLGQDLSRTAEEAEAAGDYLKAAELYAQMPTSQEGEALRRKRARCLVKAERCQDAILLFQDGNWKDSEALYDWGFSLARTGQYHQCLRVWEGIPSRDERFLAQKQAVCDLLAQSLYGRFERGDDPGAIYREGKSLLGTGGEEGNLADLVKSCGFSWLQELWKSEQYERIMEVLDSWPFDMEPTLIQIYAKTSFKLAEKAGASLHDLAMSWLSAVYAQQTADGLRSLEEDLKVRENLIRRAEALFNHYEAGEESAKSTGLTLWNLEKRLLEEISALVKGRKRDRHLICTPRLAVRCGISDQILALIRKKRKRLRDRERYLTTGAFYSSAGEALYLMEKGEIENAVASLPVGEAEDEFLEWGVTRVMFSYGLHCMDHGKRPPRGYPDTALAVLDQAPRFVNELIDGAKRAVRLDQLSRYEEFLTAVCEAGPREGLDKALSFVMSRRALEMYNQDLINHKVLAMNLRKALALDPSNEHARGLLVETRVDLECAELQKALNGHKMGRACRIASESAHQEVRDLFFEFFEAAIHNMDVVDFGVEERVFTLRKIYGWCASVDEAHDILYEIEKMIEELVAG
jgi:tetratricopeptide (TPR) repeat protein